MKRILYVSLATLIFLAALTACKAGGEDGLPIDDDNQQGPSISGSPIGTPPTTDVPLDADAISTLWQASSHAQTYVVDGNGENSACTRCHAPINYVPTVDEIPESCFVCKFELTTPPPLTEMSVWESIPCKVCHELDKKGNAESEMKWLESAAAGLYEDVDTSTELCLKCHIQVNIPNHKPEIMLSAAHADLLCADCHDAHSVEATCSNSGCHEDILSTPEISGHDTSHEKVSCIACHDASGFEVGVDEESGEWLTFTAIELADGESALVPYASHNISKEAACDRCHFSGNPWNLVDEVSTSP